MSTKDKSYPKEMTSDTAELPPPPPAPKDVDLAAVLNKGALNLSQDQIRALNHNQSAGFSISQLRTLLDDPPPSISAHQIACLQANLPAGFTLEQVHDLMTLGSKR